MQTPNHDSYVASYSVQAWKFSFCGDQSIKREQQLLDALVNIGTNMVLGES